MSICREVKQVFRLGKKSLVFGFFAISRTYLGLRQDSTLGTEVAHRARDGDEDESLDPQAAEVCVLKRFFALTILISSSAIALQANAAPLPFSPVSTVSSCPGCADGSSNVSLSPSPQRSGNPSAMAQLSDDVARILYPSNKAQLNLFVPTSAIAMESLAPRAYAFDPAAFQFETPYYSSSTGIVNSPMAPWNATPLLPHVGQLYFDMGSESLSRPSS